MCAFKKQQSENITMGLLAIMSIFFFVLALYIKIDSPLDKINTVSFFFGVISLVSFIRKGNRYLNSDKNK